VFGRGLEAEESMMRKVQGWTWYNTLTGKSVRRLELECGHIQSRPSAESKRTPPARVRCSECPVSK
jgi:hypothetical protein